jgi:hypothetical protein
MKEVVIKVDVYGRWDERAPIYRVYVDNDLLTERDFIWHNNYICENIIVNLEPGMHTVKIEQTTAYGTITAKNIRVNGVDSSTEFTITE